MGEQILQDSLNSFGVSIRPGPVTPQAGLWFHGKSCSAAVLVEDILIPRFSSNFTLLTYVPTLAIFPSGLQP